MQSFCVVDLSNFYLDIAKDRLYVSSPNQFRRRSCQFVLSKIIENLAVLISPVLCHMAEDIWQNLPYKVQEKSVFQRGWPSIPSDWKNLDIESKMSNLRKLRVEINKVIEGCRNQQQVGAALETEIMFLPKDKKLKEALIWLNSSGNPEVDCYSDWLIVSNFLLIDNPFEESLLTVNNEFGTIQIQKAKGIKCDRCWHFQEFTFKGKQNTNLCKRCAEIIK